MNTFKTATLLVILGTSEAFIATGPSSKTAFSLDAYRNSKYAPNSAAWKTGGSSFGAPASGGFAPTPAAYAPPVPTPAEPAPAAPAAGGSDWSNLAASWGAMNTESSPVAAAPVPAAAPPAPAAPAAVAAPAPADIPTNSDPDYGIYDGMVWDLESKTVVYNMWDPNQPRSPQNFNPFETFEGNSPDSSGRYPGEGRYKDPVRGDANWEVMQKEQAAAAERAANPKPGDVPGAPGCKN